MQTDDTDVNINDLPPLPVIINPTKNPKKDAANSISEAQKNRIKTKDNDYIGYEAKERYVPSRLSPTQRTPITHTYTSPTHTSPTHTSTTYNSDDNKLMLTLVNKIHNNIVIYQNNCFYKYPSTSKRLKHLTELLENVQTRIYPNKKILSSDEFKSLEGWKAYYTGLITEEKKIIETLRMKKSETFKEFIRLWRNVSILSNFSALKEQLNKIYELTYKLLYNIFGIKVECSLSNNEPTLRALINIFNQILKPNIIVQKYLKYKSKYLALKKLMNT